MRTIKKTPTLFFLLGTLSISSFFFVSCQHESSEWTTQEKETVKKEISGIVEGIVQGGNSLDAEAALKAYSDSPDFQIVNTDGSVEDYQEMKNSNTEFFRQAASIRFTTVKDDFRFLSKTMVLCTWLGSYEFELKSGERTKIEHYAGSMLFIKTNNEWKIIYAHESASTPIREHTQTHRKR